MWLDISIQMFQAVILCLLSPVTVISKITDRKFISLNGKWRLIYRGKPDCMKFRPALAGRKGIARG